MSLEALRQALAPRLADHPEVQVATLQARTEFVTLTVEPEHGPHRFLRAAATELDGEEVYVMRWSSYRNASERDDAEGTALGDLASTLRAIEQWIIEGRSWRDVPEFRIAPESPDR